MLLDLTSATFAVTIATWPVVVVDFWAPWCGPCTKLAPVLERLAAEFPQIVAGKVNIDDQPRLAQAAGVMTVPTVHVYAAGELASSEVAPTEASLRQAIRAAIQATIGGLEA